MSQMQMQIVARTKVDFNTLLSAVLTTTDRRIADNVDALPYKISEDDKFARCVAELIESEKDSPAVESQIFFSVLVLLEDYDLQHVVSAATNLAWVGSGTTKRGVFIGLLSGTLFQWRGAVNAARSRLDSQDFASNLTQLFKDEGFTV